MTPDQIKAVVERISLDGLVPRVDLRYADGVEGPCVVITRYVTDTDHGSLGPVSVVYPVPSWARLGRTPISLLTWLRECVKGNLAHDVDEFFRFDGCAIFHPHRGSW